MDVQDYFSKVEDPRVVGRCKHKLSDILVIALASYLCEGEIASWCMDFTQSEMTLFAY